MLQTADVGLQALDSCRVFVTEEEIQEIRRLARELHRAKILHLNASHKLLRGRWVSRNITLLKACSSL